MAQKNANSLLKGKRIRFIHPHPDDSIADSQLYGHDADEALLTRGEKGRNPKHRVAEEQAAAAILGFKGVILYPGRDGYVKEDVDELARMIADDAIRDGVDVLASTLFTDHPDHIATTKITIEAARRMARVGRAVGVLLIRHGNEGEYTTEATQESVTRAFQAANQHRQWRMRPHIHEDWPVVGGTSIHPDDLAALQPYPLLRDASYTWLPPEHFLVEQAESLALAAR